MLLLGAAFMCAVIWAGKPVETAGAVASLSSLAGTGASEEMLEKASALMEENMIDRNWVDTTESVLNKKKYTKKELKYMSAIIYCEAGDMGFEAKVAVGNVILNRMNDKGPGGWSHVNTIYEVIYDRKWGVQFSPTAGSSPAMDRALAIYKSMDPDEWKDWQIRTMNESIEAAKAVLNGVKVIPDTYMYFNGHIDSTKAKCKEKGWKFTIIEKHIYFDGN